MKSLLLSITTLLLIVGCGTETKVKDYPFTVGTWEVTSPRHANYIGTQKHQKTNAIIQSSDNDTLTIAKPGDYELDIIQDTADTGIYGVILTFKDYSAYIDSIRPSATVINIDSTIMYNGFGPARNVVRYHDHLDYSLEILYECSAEFKDDNLFVETYTEKDELYKVYNFKTSGLQQVFKELTYACNN